MAIKNLVTQGLLGPVRFMVTRGYSASEAVTYTFLRIVKQHLARATSDYHLAVGGSTGHLATSQGEGYLET